MFDRTRVALGQGHLDRWAVFECKRFLSVYVHRFNTVAQDRFHTHAFHAVAVVLRGGYDEEYKVGPDTRTKTVRRGMRVIPRAYNHRLLRSVPNTLSVVIAGPWARYWTEERGGSVRTLTWGRRVVTGPDPNSVARAKCAPADSI